MIVLTGGYVSLMCADIGGISLSLLQASGLGLHCTTMSVPLPFCIGQKMHLSLCVYELQYMMGRKIGVRILGCSKMHLNMYVGSRRL